MKMKKSVTIAYISLFVISICALHMIFFACKGLVDTGNYENRPLNELPSLSDTSLSDYSDKFEGYFNDHIPFRNQLISLNNKINYYLFKATLGDQVLIGKDGWLFIKDKMQGNAIANYTGEDALSDEELSQIADNVVRNKAYLESQGMEFVVMIAPNKSRIYSEYMPDYLGEPNEVYAVLQIVDYLKTNTDVRVVYNYDALMDAKSQLESRDISIYHKVDTHWNNVGAYVGAADLLHELGVSVPSVADVNIEAVANGDADLAGMLHMKGDFINTENNYIVSGYKAEDVSVSKLQENFNEVIEYASNAKDKRCVYINRDSFATAMGEYIGSQFARTYMRHYGTYTAADLESVSPDVFVYEVAERSAAYGLANLSLWE